MIFALSPDHVLLLREPQCIRSVWMIKRFISRISQKHWGSMRSDKRIHCLVVFYDTKIYIPEQFMSITGYYSNDTDGLGNRDGTGLPLLVKYYSINAALTYLWHIEKIVCNYFSSDPPNSWRWMNLRKVSSNIQRLYEVFWSLLSKPKSGEVRAWTHNDIHLILGDVITHPWSRFYGTLVNHH